MNPSRDPRRFLSEAVRLAVLLFFVALSWRSARRLVFTEWDLPIRSWIWWPVFAGLVGFICVLIDARQGSSELPHSMARVRKWLFASSVVALLVFVLLGWVVNDSGPALIVNPLQAEVGQPDGWVVAGGNALGRHFWQPAFLVHVGTGAAVRIGYYIPFTCAVSPPPLMEYAISSNEEHAIWVEPVERWLPWPGWQAWVRDRSGWPMRLFVADISGGRVRKTSTGIVFPGGVPALALSPDGSRTAVLETDCLACLDSRTWDRLAEFPYQEFTGSSLLPRASLHFASSDKLYVYSQQDNFSHPTNSPRLDIFEVNLENHSVSYSATVEGYGGYHLSFASSQSTFLLVFHPGDHATVHDGRTGTQLAADQAAFELLKTELGYDVRPFFEPAPSQVSAIPGFLVDAIRRLQKRCLGY